MKFEDLFELSVFLTKCWGEKENVSLSEANVASCGYFSGKYNMTVNNLEALAKGQWEYQKYRLYRATLWHESMHMRETPTAFMERFQEETNPTVKAIINVMEDLRINRRGLIDYPGMISEILFERADARAAVINSPPSNVLDMFLRKILLGIEYPNLPSKAKDAEKPVLEYINKDSIQYGEAADIARKIMLLLNCHTVDPDNVDIVKLILVKTSRQEIEGEADKILEDIREGDIEVLPLDMQELAEIISSEDDDEEGNESEFSEEAEAVTMPTLDVNMDDDKKDPTTLTYQSKWGTPEVYKEFQEMKKKEHERELSEAQDLGMIERARQIEDPSQYFDGDLIQRLLSGLRKWFTGWKEIHSVRGDEFDSETYLSGSDKPFFYDQRLDHTMSVILLLDHSGSISNTQESYKTALNTVCNVFDRFGIKFEVFVFSSFQSYEKILCVKTVKDKWDSKTAGKLAAVNAGGNTPLGKSYQRVYEQIQRFKPKLFLTLTDGHPTDTGSEYYIKKFKGLGIKMFGIAFGSDNANFLEGLGYDRFFAIDTLDELPQKLFRMLVDVE